MLPFLVAITETECVPHPVSDKRSSNGCPCKHGVHFPRRHYKKKYKTSLCLILLYTFLIGHPALNPDHKRYLRS